MPSNKTLTSFIFFFSCYVIIAMHIVKATPGGSGLYIIPNIISWIFLPLLLVTGFYTIIKKAKIEFTLTHQLYGLGFLFLCIPLLYNTANVIDSLPRLLGLAGGLLLLMTLTQFSFSKKNKLTLLFVLLLGITIEAFIGLTQLFILDPFNIQVLGYTPLSGRPYGSFMQPNVMASFMATGIALSLFILQSSLFSLKSTTSLTKKYSTALIYFCLFSCSLLLITLQSKTGYLGLVVVLMLYMPLFIKNIKKFRVSILVVILGVICGITAMKSLQTVDRAQALYSAQARSEMYKVSAHMFLDKPLTGVGYGTFSRSYIEYERENRKALNTTSDPNGNLRHPHNETLYWLAEGGIAPLVGILIFSFAYLLLFRKKPLVAKLPVFTLIIPILIHSQTEYPFYHSTAHWVYFICFLWIAEDTFSVYKERHLSNTFVVKLACLFIPLITIPFMVTALHTSIKMEEYRVNQYTDAKPFNDIVNTLVWHDYIGLVVHLNQLDHGLYSKNIPALIGYIHWASEFVQHKPSDFVYHDILLAIATLESIGGEIDPDMKSEILHDAFNFFNLLPPKIAPPKIDATSTEKK